MQEIVIAATDGSTERPEGRSHVHPQDQRSLQVSKQWCSAQNEDASCSPSIVLQVFMVKLKKFLFIDDVPSSWPCQPW